MTTDVLEETRVDIATLVEAAGISLRQADYWTRRGWLVADERERPQTGYPRSYDVGQVEVARVMGELGRLLGVPPPVAYPIARALLDHGDYRIGYYTLTRRTT